MFRIGVTRDFLNPDGTMGENGCVFEQLNAAGVEWEFLPESAGELSADLVRDYDGLLVLGPRITQATLTKADRLLIVARFGVGYDTVDVEACTAAGVLLTITPDGVRRPVATVVMTLLLALSHKLLIKDRLIRAGRWAEKLGYMGQGLTGRTLGVVGLGNIGRETFRLAQPFGMRHLGYDPFVSADQVRELGVETVDLDTLLKESDYVAICCALTAQTRHLIGPRQLGLLKPTAYVINVARGPIIDQAALFDALQAGRIAGAGLDVFEQEPIDPADPLLSLENVILAPHGLAWTDECFRGIAQDACQSLLDVAAGRTPRHGVNQAALAHPKWRGRATSC